VLVHWVKTQNYGGILLGYELGASWVSSWLDYIEYVWLCFCIDGGIDGRLYLVELYWLVNTHTHFRPRSYYFWKVACLPFLFVLPDENLCLYHLALLLRWCRYTWNWSCCFLKSYNLSRRILPSFCYPVETMPLYFILPCFIDIYSSQEVDQSF
jgi:hypothetical protein